MGPSLDPAVPGGYDAIRRRTLKVRRETVTYPTDVRRDRVVPARYDTTLLTVPRGAGRSSVRDTMNRPRYLEPAEISDGREHLNTSHSIYIFVHLVLLPPAII